MVYLPTFMVRYGKYTIDGWYDMVCIYPPASSKQPFDSHLRHRACVSVTSWRGFGGWGEKELDLMFLVVGAKNKRAHMWTLGSLFGQSSSCHMDAKYSCLCAESIRLGPCSSPALG